MSGKNQEKSKFVIGVCVAGAAAVLLVPFLFHIGRKRHNVTITISIPAGSSGAFVYSDEEISPQKSRIILASGKGSGDHEVVLKPLEAKEENIYEPVYITEGAPVKIDAEKGAWFKVGVNVQNPTDEDRMVSITVKGADVRIQ